MPNDGLELLMDVLTRTDEFLWNAYHVGEAGTLATLTPHLSLAMKSNGSLSKSEQAARFFFAFGLETSPFRYRIEMPTKKTYLQKGKRNIHRAGSFDMVVETELSELVANCEFKYGGCSLKSRDQMPHRKDIEKLLRDPGDGIWFHLLEGVNNSTITNVLKALADDLFTLLDKYRYDCEAKRLIFHVCALRLGFSICKILEVNPQQVAQEELVQQFDFEYKVARDGVLHLESNNGWRVFRRSSVSERVTHGSSSTDR